MEITFHQLLLGRKEQLKQKSSSFRDSLSMLAIARRGRAVEMVFGDSFLVLEHVNSGIKIQFNTFESFDAPTAWNQEALPPVEYPADAKSKFRRIIGNEASSIKGKDFNGKEELLLALSSLLLVPNLGKIKKDTGIPPKQEALGGQSRSLCACESAIKIHIADLWNASQVHNFVRTSSVRAFTVNFWVKLFKRFDIDWCLSIHCGKLNGIGLENVCHYKHFVLMSDSVNMDASSAQENSETRQSSSPRQTTSIQELEFCSKTLFGEATEEHPIGTENVNKGSTKARAAECDYIGIEQFEPLNEDLTLYLSCEQLGQQLEDASMYSNSSQLGLLPEDAAGKNLSSKQTMPELNHELVPGSVNKDIWVEKWKTGTVNFQNVPAEIVTVESHTYGFEQPGRPSEEMTRNSSWEQLRPPQEDERKKYLEQLGVPPEDKVVNTSLEQLEMPPDDAANNPSKSGGRTSGKSTKEKHALRSSVGSTRVLRSRLQEKSKAPEASNNMEEKKRQMKKISVDEFSRLRNRLRYLLNRIGYHQTLIDAYSGKDWRGQSLETKPVELQDAQFEILHCKLKIRHLFQHLDLLTARGKFPASLFDSEGQIDSDDIFCAKCGCKDSPADNDIILCDGDCEHGSIQFCLEPPLLKEDIPPGDEGWLCPGCDCKVNCIKLLNDSQGTNFSILDTWETVFPLEATINKDFGLGFSSDDSEENDYDPDPSEVDEKVEGDESSSDDSDFYSASKDFGASPNNEQNLENSSDDSEDDDYDPTAPDLDEQEAYGNVSCDSSDGLDADGIPKKRRKNNTDKVASASPCGRTPIVEGTNAKDMQHSQGESEHTPKRRAHEEPDVEGTNNSPAKFYERGSNGTSTKRFGEASTQELAKSFNENHYPDRAMKEKLATELEITVKQVSKWFANARWKFRHPSPARQRSTTSGVRKRKSKSDDHQGSD
ncbi:hypothetical protein ACSBR2_021699 [Camellia fascicularis]